MNDHTQSALTEHSILRRSAPFLAVFVVAVLMTACGNKRIIQTADDSADYSSARSLPPLKKPSQAAVKSQQETSSDPVVTVTEPAAEESSAPEVSVQEDTPVLVDQQVTDDSAKDDAVEEPATQASANAIFNASVIDVGDGKSRLEINADIEGAWRYLTANLQKSDITLFSRNRAAGRFAIGCSGVAEDAVNVEKKGSWSFFKRGENQESDYCALQVIEKRGQTHVSVLDRSGTEVASANSAGLFARILNN